jgi:hypothetical protein
VNTALAILAHEAARPTIADFFPRWQKLGLPMLGFVPDGHRWPGPCIETVFAQGKSSHDGPDVIDRFILALETLHDTEYDRFVLMEYDTVNLVDRLPKIDWSLLSAGIMNAFHDGCPGDSYYIALSPWIFTRETLRPFLAGCLRQRKHPSYQSWVKGLLDRFVAVVITEEKIPASSIPELMPFPFEALKPLEAIPLNNMTWVHGWKRKEQFKHLWPRH